MSEQIAGQINLFSFVPDENKTFDFLKAVVLMGSGFENGKQRILAFFSEKHTTKEELEFLKNEYGTGGWTLNFRDHPEAHFVDHDSSGLKIIFCHGDMTKEKSWASKNYTYKDVANKIHECISDGSYNEKEGW